MWEVYFILLEDKDFVFVKMFYLLSFLIIKQVVYHGYMKMSEIHYFELR